MNNALKGVLLSGLVLPGLGQFLLKRKLRGTVIMVVTLSTLAALMIQVTRMAIAVLANIDLQAAQVDTSVFYNAVEQASTGGGSVLSLLLLVCWLGSVVDAYLIGKKMDKEGQPVT